MYTTFCKRFALVLSASTFFTSCSVQKPNYVSSSQGSNHTTVLTKPYLHKQPSLIKPLIVGGVAFGAGFLLAANSMEMEDQTANGTTVKRPYTEDEAVAFGGLIGVLALSSSFGYVIIERKQGGKDIAITDDRTRQKWFNKYNRRNGHKFVDYYSISNQLFLTTSETFTDYRFLQVEDISRFKQLFPSKSPEAAIQRTLQGVTVSEAVLYEMLTALSPNSLQIKEIGKRYTLFASNVTTLFNRQETYKTLTKTELSLEVIKRAAAFEDLELYQLKMGESTPFDNQIIDKIYKNCTNTQLNKIIDRYPEYPKYKELVVTYISKLSNIPDLKSALSQFGASFKSDVEKGAVRIVMGNRSNVRTFETSFPNSKYLISDNNKVFVGNSIQTTGSPQGTGVLYEKNTAKYLIGTFRNGDLDGATCRIYGENFSYEGACSFGKKHGKGKMSQTPQYTYEGDFLEDEMHGSGYFKGDLSEITPVTAQGDYSGQFYQGFPVGYGKLSFENGAIWYEGNFKDGRFEGQGTLRMPNGVRFTGPWKNHEPNGRIHIYKYTLLGLIREDYYKEAHGWKDLGSGEGALLSQWNSARADERKRANEEIREERIRKESEKRAKEQAETQAKVAEKEQKRLDECVRELDASLSEVRVQDYDFLAEIVQGTSYKVIYHGKGFWKDPATIWKEDDNKWYCNVGGMFSSDKGPYRSKDQAMEKVCKIRLEIKD